ncbi:MAG: hypothetical protein HPZ79_10005 [Oscillospiraceae bacterium]|nr:hypothetical protein [Oscillospiraceae bacterium]
MWKQKAHRLLAVLLAVLLLSQAAAFQTVAFAADDVAVPVLKDGTAVIPSGADLATVKDILCEALVENADAVDAQSLEWEYECKGKTKIMGIDSWGNRSFGSIEGFSTSNKVGLIKYEYEHPALSANADDDYQIRLAGTETAVTLTKAAKLSSSITLNTSAAVKLVYTDATTVDYNAVRQQIWANVVASTAPELTLDDVTIEYYATATTGAVGNLGHAWIALEGGTKDALHYPAMTEGTQKIRISYAGDDTHSAASAEVDVNVVGRSDVAYTLKEGPYEVGMVFNDDLSYNYTAVAQAIFDAVLESTEPELTFDDMTVEYNADPTSLIDVWSPLDKGGINAFGLGTWEIRFSWNGTTEYKSGSLTVKVTVTDSRIASNIVFKEGAAITYNMDANAMKQDLFQNAIDWSASTLPEGASMENFTFEYYGTNVLGDNISGGIKNWAPIEGGTVNLLTYPQMGAGENQQVRISYAGNAEYRPVNNVEGTVTVNKATVKVTVHSTNIYPDERVPEGFVTTDPADRFDIYTIYTGVTSDVDAYVYLQLPARFTNETVLKILDPVVEKIYGKSFSDIMRDGMTIGELRELLSTQDLLDLLDKLNIDTGTFGQILSVLNKLPGIADNVHVAFGSPNRAGLYAVTAITDNKNYETGVGTGLLLVKMRMIGSKLEWNQEIKKLTVAQAAAADFGAHVTYNGEPVVSDNVHYLYSGITSNWRIYSSTTTAPTEPGRYTVTVVTLGGSYLAAPITRSFQITK